jgi:hypothetical protein
MRQTELPPDVSVLLQYLAGEIPASQVGCGNVHVHDTVERYVLTVMLFPGAPPGRVLGLTGCSPRNQARAHVRWLMLWLHPDKSGSPWRASYCARVIEAWHVFSRSSQSHTNSSPTPTQRRRPSTNSIKLAWVASPVPVDRPSKYRFVGPAVLMLSLTLFAVIDGPARRLAQNIFFAHTWSP